MLGTVDRAVPESRRIVFLYILTGAVFATIAARGLTVPLYAHELGASRFTVGALFSVATLAGAALSLPAGVLVDRFGARNLLAVSLVLTAVSQVATALTPRSEERRVGRECGPPGARGREKRTSD